MNENEYFEISIKKDLPLRCPILNYCGRRACTIYLNSDYYKYSNGFTRDEVLINDGTLPEDYNEKKIDIQGESPTLLKSTNHYYFEGMCPEVNLFDSAHSMFQNQACVSAEYDKLNSEPKHKILKTKHFSECSEFNKYNYENKLQERIVSKKTRKAIPAKIKVRLQKEINSKCPFCKNNDVEHFQIHHIDGNPRNNEVENLIMLCPICHSKITKNDISIEEVIIVKHKIGKLGIKKQMF